MRSVLLAGVPGRHTPAHAKPSRLPAAATTAGLSLSLIPAMLVGTAGAADAAGTTAKIATGIRISAPPTSDGIHSTLLGARLFTKADNAYAAGGKVAFQRYTSSGWRTLKTATTSTTGLAQVRVVLTGNSLVRVYYPGGTTRAAVVSPILKVVGPRTTLGQRAVAEAARHYGKAYRYGSTGPSTFDCSGLTGYVYARLGKALPRTSGAQASALRRISVSDKRVGDLIFTWTSGRVSHVGIYAGNNQMWAATKTGDIVRKQTIYSRSITVGRVA